MNEHKTHFSSWMLKNIQTQRFKIGCLIIDMFLNGAKGMCIHQSTRLCTIEVFNCNPLISDGHAYPTYV